MEVLRLTIAVNASCALTTEVLVNDSEYIEFLLSLPFIDELQLLYGIKIGVPRLNWSGRMATF